MGSHWREIYVCDCSEFFYLNWRLRRDENTKNETHLSNRDRDEELRAQNIQAIKSTEETHLVVFPVESVLCNFLSKFRIHLDFRRFKWSHFRFWWPKSFRKTYNHSMVSYASSNNLHLFFKTQDKLQVTCPISNIWFLNRRSRCFGSHWTCSVISTLHFS